MLGLATLLLTVSVAAGASRSAMAGLAAAALLRGDRRAASGASGPLVAVDGGDRDQRHARGDRLCRSRSADVARRRDPRSSAWHNASPSGAIHSRIVRDFPVTGVGAGNFANAMRVYQSGDRTYFWNEAHNEYLQVAAEGGLLFVVPVAVGLIALCRAGWRACTDAGDHLRWMRIGAAASLVAVAIQSIWETGVTLPANGMLAAVAAAILVHRSRHAPDAPAGD